MLNLEQAISEWRRQMIAAGIKTPVPLEELESHLREEMEHLRRSGLNALAAFELATRRIGHPRVLKREFAKGNSSMKRTLMIISGLLVIAVGMAWILPALAHYRDHGVMTGENLGFLSLGIVVTLVGICTAAWSFKKRQA